MRALPVDDDCFGTSVIYPSYLFRVRAPAQSR
jgi:hypothetical protein